MPNKNSFIAPSDSRLPEGYTCPILNVPEAPHPLPQWGEDVKSRLHLTPEFAESWLKINPDQSAASRRNFEAFKNIDISFSRNDHPALIDEVKRRLKEDKAVWTEYADATLQKVYSTSPPLLSELEAALIKNLSLWIRDHAGYNQIAKVFSNCNWPVAKKAIASNAPITSMLLEVFLKDLDATKALIDNPQFTKKHLDQIFVLAERHISRSLRLETQKGPFVSNLHVSSALKSLADRGLFPNANGLDFLIGISADHKWGRQSGLLEAIALCPTLTGEQIKRFAFDSGRRLWSAAAGALIANHPQTPEVVLRAGVLHSRQAEADKRKILARVVASRPTPDLREEVLKDRAVGVVLAYLEETPAKHLGEDIHNLISAAPVFATKVLESLTRSLPDDFYLSETAINLLLTSSSRRARTWAITALGRTQMTASRPARNSPST